MPAVLTGFPLESGGLFALFAVKGYLPHRTFGSMNRGPQSKKVLNENFFDTFSTLLLKNLFVLRV
jgi:hypothetical protein